MKYKLLKDCKQNDWVYHEAGELYMVDKEKGSSGFSLTNGTFRCYTSYNTKLYPLTLHNKFIADGIKWYADKMFEKNLINGSKWIYWLNEKMGELIELDENAPCEEFKAIWDTIENKIEELENAKL